MLHNVICGFIGRYLKFILKVILNFIFVNLNFFTAGDFSFEEHLTNIPHGCASSISLNARLPRCIDRVREAYFPSALRYNLDRGQQPSSMKGQRLSIFGVTDDAVSVTIEYNVTAVQ